MIDFSHLSDADFEELCYELIAAKGFKNLSWRKGSGKATSPSDNGRDIEADKIETDFDRSTNLSKYFFECKHYKKGVPPSEIEGAFAWAQAESPYCLVIIASNFLSNPCKNWIEDYKKNNKPKYQIRIWENKLLEELLTNENNICLKWKINIQNLNYRYINKYHLAYVTKPCLNKFDYLFDILDNYNKEIRDEILQYTYFDISLRKNFKSINNYANFKEQINKNRSEFDEALFVHQMISEVLAWAYHMGDIAEIEKTRENLIAFKKHIENRRGADDNMTEHITKQINSLDERVKKCYKYYNDFCDTVVFDLLAEPYTFNEGKQ